MMRSSLALAAMALLSTACASAGGRGRGGGGSGESGSGSDSGSAAPGTGPIGGPVTSAACVYQTRTASHCSGDTTTSDWQTVCNDMPCSHESWDPYTVSAGDCYGDTEYQGAYDYPGSCGAWSAASTPAGCGDFPIHAGLTSDCQSCLGEVCCSQTRACASGTDCGALYDCYGACTSDPTCGEADAGECACMSACEGQHPEGLNAPHDLEQCVVSGCVAPCSTGG